MTHPQTAATARLWLLLGRVVRQGERACKVVEEHFLYSYTQTETASENQLDSKERLK